MCRDLSTTMLIFAGLVSVLLLLPDGTIGHTLHPGRSCPETAPFPNLDIERILGDWYVLHKTDTDNNCLVWNITRGDFPDSLTVKESRQLFLLDLVGYDHTHAVTAKIDIPNPEVPGKMRIRWPTSLTGKADFTVIDIDYGNYMAIFECDRAGILHRRSTTILSRTKTMDSAMVERVRRLLDTFDVGHTYLSEIDHNSCNQSANRKQWHIDQELLSFIPGLNIGDSGTTNGDAIFDIDLTGLEIVEDGGQQSAFDINGRPDIKK